MADSDATRAVARQHTTQLLKMLRGYGPATTDPEEPAAHSQAVSSAPLAGIVAEAPSAYIEHFELTQNRQRTLTDADAIRADPPAPPPQIDQRPIFTVGEGLFRQKGVLGELMERAEQLVRLNRIFRAYLPPHLHDHAILIRLDAEEWVVHTDASSWATRLRYALHNIRETLAQQLGIPLPKPRICVVPAAGPSHKPRPPMKLTKRSAKVLEIAAHNQSDERLSAALRKLAAHAHSPAPR